MGMSLSVCVCVDNRWLDFCLINKHTMEKALHHLHLFDFGEPFFHAFQTRNGETKVNEYRVKHLCEFLKRIFRVECEFVNVLCVRVSFLSNGKKRNLIFYITKI